MNENILNFNDALILIYGSCLLLSFRLQTETKKTIRIAIIFTPELVHPPPLHHREYNSALPGARQ